MSKVRLLKNGKDPDECMWVDSNGYKLMRNPEDNRKMHVHRYVMEQKIGRKLVKGESVHHKNGIRDDNDPDNLELWVGAIRFGQRASEVVCPHCSRKWGE
jgi:hypothetical protein